MAECYTCRRKRYFVSFGCSGTFPRFQIISENLLKTFMIIKSLLKDVLSTFKNFINSFKDFPKMLQCNIVLASVAWRSSHSGRRKRRAAKKVAAEGMGREKT